MAEIPISFLLKQLEPLLIEEVRLLGSVREEVMFIKDELEQMKAFVRVADAKKETDPQLQVWVNQVQDVAYDTEDVLNEFMLRLGHDHGDGFHGFLRKIACSIKNLKARHQIASRLQKIKSRVINISKVNCGRYRITEQGSSSFVISNTMNDGRGDALLIEEAELVGIEKPKQQLISWLIDGDSQLKVVSVVGMGGLGKTTLVKQVFDDTQVKRQFQSHAWVTVSQSFDMMELLKNMIRKLQAQPEGVETMSNNELKAVIKEFLKEKRYVVVLDDVWSVEAWDAIKYALPDGNCGSRVLLTTRVLDVASTSRFESRGYVCEMNALSDQESWTLFCNKTFKNKCCPQHLEELSRNILRKCEGLPLAIVTIGGLLALKDQNRIDEWEMVQRDLNELEGHDKYERMIKILSLSYNDLPYHLKICFIYLSIFPEDYEIKRKKVIRLWTALQFVQESERKTSKEVAEGYFDELVNRSLIQVADTTLKGRPKKCRIHDLLRAIILSKSREQNIVTLARELDVKWPDKVRHLAFHCSEDLQQQRKHFRALRSLLMFDTEHPQCQLSVFSLLIGCSKFLNVIDLSHIQFKTIPDDVFKLRHLRYLSMMGSKLETIPKSIGKLQNLETLDLSYNRLSYLPVEIGNLKKLQILDLRGNHLLELPIEIGKLQKLRHLYVCDWDRGFSGCTIPAEIGNLSSLQKIRTISAYKKNGTIIMGEIEKLTQLKSLHIANLTRKDGVVLCSSLEKLSKLGSLSVWSDDFIDLPSFPSSPPLLRKLVLGGPLERVPHWIPFLYGLVKVRFESTGLRDDPLQCLQDLPNLIRLTLHRAFDGEELCFKAGGFPRLKKLRIIDLKELRWVRIEPTAMLHLVYISLLGCTKLEDEPWGIEDLPKLGKFALSGMSESLIKTLSYQYRVIGQYPKLAHIHNVSIGYHTDGGGYVSITH